MNILSGLLVFVLAMAIGCSKVSKDAQNETDNKQLDEPVATSVTEQDIEDMNCKSSPRPNSVYGSWIRFSNGELASYQTNLIINSNTITLEKVCTTVNGVSTSVRIDVMASVIGNSIQILQNNQSNQILTVGSQALNCTAELKRQEVRYSFVYGCLQLTTGTSKALFKLNQSAY